MFFEVEKLEESYWEQNDVEEEFFWTLFRSLRQNIATQKCPHYWIKTLNLFADMNGKDYAFIEAKLEKIKEQPVEYIASEWIEWNRHMRKNCCTSCINPAHEEVFVVNNDVEPIKICCCPCIWADDDNDHIRRYGSGFATDDNKWNIEYNDVVIQVY